MLLMSNIDIDKNLEDMFPAIGKRLKASWVEGKYMLTISEKELESQIPALLERKMKKYIEECFNNGW